MPQELSKAPTLMWALRPRRRESIAVLERRLDSQRFVRIRRSAIVNINRVRELQPMFHGEFVVVLQSGRRLRCSRTYANELIEALGS
jgi:two-component system LytT family response regulator